MTLLLLKTSELDSQGIDWRTYIRSLKTRSGVITVIALRSSSVRPDLS